MSPKGRGSSENKLTGQVIIDQLIRNMEIGQFEMGFSILLPCVFSLYLHPDDYNRLSGVMEFLKDDAKKALGSKLDTLNSRPLLPLGRGNKDRKQYKIACKDWALEFFPDAEGTVPPGDVEIHSELNELPQPGYHGAKTTLLEREPSVGESTRNAEGRKPSPAMTAELRYEDDSGPQFFLMHADDITVGRGGNDLQVNVALYTNDEVSREHLRIRRDPARSSYFITDLSRNGTWVNGHRLARGMEAPLPDRAEISVAEIITMQFEVKR